MRAASLLAPGLVLLVALSASPAPQEQPAGRDALCGECHTTGRVDFVVPKEIVEQEKGCNLCSEVVANEAANYGIDFKPCPKCKAPSLQAIHRKQWEAKRDAGLAWLKERREIDAFLDDPKNLKLMHCSTDHFELAFSLPKLKVGRIVYEQHQAMHIYANRLEAAYKTWLDKLGLKHETDLNANRHTIMLFEQAKHATKAQPKYCGLGGTAATEGVKLVGVKSVFVAWWNKTKNRDDEEFHEYVVHNLDHLFLASYYNYFWLIRKNGWVDEGLSHYFTGKQFEKARTHCFQEQDEANNWILTPWRPEIRKRVSMNKLPVFAEVIQKHGESLTAEEHLFCWSWVDYLLDGMGPEGVPKFVQLVRGLKEQIPLRNILQDVYGVSPFQFLENWKKYVLENYPAR